MPAAASRATRFSTASSPDDFEARLGSKRALQPCWKRVVSPGDPVVLCCAVVFGAFIFLSSVLRSSVDPGGKGGAAAVPTGPSGAPEGFVAVEQKVFKKATAEDAAGGLGGERAAQEARAGEMNGDVNILQDQIKTEKRKLRLLKKQERKLEKERAVFHVDHAKQHVLEERKLLDKEEQFERKEEDVVRKEKNIVKSLRRDLDAEEKLLNSIGHDKDGLAKAESLDKDERRLEEAVKKQEAKFKKVHDKEMKTDEEDKDVTNTWMDIKAKHGASKNIELKHNKEEKRHIKIRKNIVAVEDKFAKVEANHEKLAKREAELQRRLHDAEVAAAGVGGL